MVKIFTNLPINNSERSKAWIIELFWQIGVPLVFVLIVLLFFPSRGRFEFDNDEGINLMKAALLESGYSLYDEIWSDQPPLFTQMLAGVIGIFGNKVGAARALVLGFSAVLFWAFFLFVRTTWGNLHALAGSVILFSLPEYLKLSIAVMVGLPSITFAVLSLLGLTAWHKHRRDLWLILSAIALTISIMIKLFTVFLAPIFAVGLIIAERSQYPGKKVWVRWLIPVIIWGSVFAITTVTLALLFVGPKNVLQLVETHIFASDLDAFDNVEWTINWHLQDVLPTILLALAGSISTIYFRRWLAIYPLAWMVVGYLLLLNYSPVWYHQQLLVTIPAGMLAAGSVDWILYLLNTPQLQKLKFSREPIKFVITIGVLLIFLSFQRYNPLEILEPKISLQSNDLEMLFREELMLAEMVTYAPKTQWVVTDKPMFAFRARLLVPPNLAVISKKRLRTGNLTEQDMIDTIKTYRPEQILFKRDRYLFVERFLEEDYEIRLSRGKRTHLYFRNDLIRDEINSN